MCNNSTTVQYQQVTWVAATNHINNNNINNNKNSIEEGIK